MGPRTRHRHRVVVGISVGLDGGEIQAISGRWYINLRIIQSAKPMH